MQILKKSVRIFCLSILFLLCNKEPVIAFQAINNSSAVLNEFVISIPDLDSDEDSIEPVFHGQFISAGEKRTFTFEITNDSYNTIDVFEFQIEAGWQTNLYDQMGRALIDSDGDGLVESEPVAVRTTVTVQAVVSAPAFANVGDYQEATITVFSENAGNINGIHVFQSAVPAPFAQMYADYGKNSIYLNLITPDKQTIHTTGPEEYYGFSPTLAGKDRFVLAWRKYHYANIAWNSDIEYSVFNHQGNLIVPQFKLTQNNDEILTINDFRQVASTMDNGLTGIFWVRSIYENFVTQPVENLWFVVLNFDGTIKSGPQKITNNIIPAQQNGGISYRNTGITAIGTDHFILTWVERLEGGFETVETVTYSVFNSNAENVKPASNLTGQAYDYRLPIFTERPLSITTLQNEKAIIISADETNLFYSVVNRNGVIIKRATDSGFPINNVDVVQLSGGNTIAAMPVIEADGWFNYFILDGVDHEMIRRSAAGTPDNSFYNQYTLSVTRDDANHAILSWVSSYNSYTYEHLMYSLLDALGNTITPPTRFYQAAVKDANTPWIIFPLVASPNGYGNAAFSQPASGRASDLSIQSVPVIPVKSGQSATIPVEIKNQGFSEAEGIEITVELDKNLNYVSDTSGFVPQKTGKTITWQIPDLDYLGRGKFEVVVQTDSSETGKRFPVVLSIESGQTECFPVDNIFFLEIFVSDLFYLPFISR